MAKDPAFLFYPNDYLGGTMGMTFEEKGAYMELLMLQFNRGHMTKHMMAQTVGQLLDKVLDKFEKDEQGLYFNTRLELEKEKRKAFVNSRLNNKSGVNQYTKKGGHMTSHMENENRNENENTIRDDFGKSENLLVPKMAKVFKEKNSNYTQDQNFDFPALKQIAQFICKQTGVSFQPQNADVQKIVLDSWEIISEWIADHKHYSNHNLQQIFKYIQSISTEIKNGKSGNIKTPGKSSTKATSAGLHQVFAKRYGKGAA